MCWIHFGELGQPPSLLPTEMSAPAPDAGIASHLYETDELFAQRHSLAFVTVTVKVRCLVSCLAYRCDLPSRGKRPTAIQTTRGAFHVVEDCRVYMIFIGKHIPGSSNPNQVCCVKNAVCMGLSSLRVLFFTFMVPLASGSRHIFVKPIRVRLYGKVNTSHFLFRSIFVTTRRKIQHVLAGANASDLLSNT